MLQEDPTPSSRRAASPSASSTTAVVGIGPANPPHLQEPV
jgi:hypothetical protein